MLETHSLYSVTLLSSTLDETFLINGSVLGFKITPTMINPNPNNAKIITFVINISGTIPPTVSRKASIALVNMAISFGRT